MGLGVDDLGTLLAQLRICLTDAKHRLEKPIPHPRYPVPVGGISGSDRLDVIGADESPEEAVLQCVGAGQVRVAVWLVRAVQILPSAVRFAALRARGGKQARWAIGGLGIFLIANAAAGCLLQLIEAVAEPLLYGSQLRTDLRADERARQPPVQRRGNLLEFCAHVS